MAKIIQKKKKKAKKQLRMKKITINMKDNED